MQDHLFQFLKTDETKFLFIRNKNIWNTQCVPHSRRNYTPFPSKKLFEQATPRFVTSNNITVLDSIFDNKNQENDTPATISLELRAAAREINSERKGIFGRERRKDNSAVVLRGGGGTCPNFCLGIITQLGRAFSSPRKRASFTCPLSAIS